MSGETTERVYRGAADPVYLFFSSFLQLSVHRACTHLLESASSCGCKDTDAERYDVLVQCEVTRRGANKDLVEMYRPYHFSVALLDAAHRSVVNATSRARGTNEAEYARLRQCAIDKQSKKTLKRARPATAEDAAAPPQVMPTTGEWPAFLRSLEEIAPVPPLDSIQATPLNEVLPVPSTSTKHQALAARRHRFA